MSSDELKILHEDDACLVAFKPAGLGDAGPVQEFDLCSKLASGRCRASGVGKNIAELKQLLREATDEARRGLTRSRRARSQIYPGLPHRL